MVGCTAAVFYVSSWETTEFSSVTSTILFYGTNAAQSKREYGSKTSDAEPRNISSTWTLLKFKRQKYNLESLVNL